jgi:hypothetical protein
VAFLLDELVRVPGTNLRFGLDPILGLIPGVGDIVAAILSFMIVGQALYYRVPRIIVMRMVSHIAVDYLVSLLPVVGDAGDFIIKSNTRNMRLLKQHAGGGTRPRTADYVFVAGILALLCVVLVGATAAVFFVVRWAFAHIAHTSW